MTRILIVEDSATQAKRLQIVLEGAGFEVQLAKSGMEGLEKSEASAFDLILSDIVMPGFSGYEFCQKIKENPKTSKIPVILVTSLTDPMEVIHALECGAESFITKPCHDETLIKRIKDVIQSKDMREKNLRGEQDSVFFLGKNLKITSSKEQVLSLLLSTFEDIVRTNTELRDSYAELERTISLLLQERDRSERLLLNVIPRSIATRLKEDGNIIADRFANATILFADVVGFTEFCVNKSPEEIVTLLNSIFSRFDKLVDIYGLEKIKTIGDAYMVVAGLPIQREDHAKAMARFALSMQEELAALNAETGQEISIRIGINSGPVIAGVLGTKKFLYDLWGDAVNTASRLEAHGIPDTIHVSESTYNLLKKHFIFEERGPIPIKGKGEMNTFFLKSECENSAGSQ